MNDDVEYDDLRDLLDDSFGDGPAAAPATDRLVPARAALRRRRFASGGAIVVGAAAAVAAVALLSGPGGPGGPGGGDRTLQPAAGPDATGIPSPSPSWLPLDCAVAAPNGQKLTNDPRTGLLSIPVERRPGKARELTSPPLKCEFAEPGTQGAGPSTTPVPGALPVVRFAGPTGEHLVAGDGTSILAQSDDVALPDNFAGAGDRTAVAKATDGDTVFYVLARQIDGSRPEYITTADALSTWPTIKAFLEHAERQYAGGAGLR